MRHGAKVKVKQCSSEGCTNYVQKGGVCIRHGGKVVPKLCSSEGCANNAQNGGVCNRHGAKVKQCSSEGCTNHIQKGGVCIGMVRRSDDADAVLKDAPIKLTKEEYVIDMGQVSSNAVVKVVLIMPNVEEFVGDTAQIALYTMNLPLLDQSSRRLPLL